MKQGLGGDFHQAPFEYSVLESIQNASKSNKDEEAISCRRSLGDSSSGLPRCCRNLDTTAARSGGASTAEMASVI